MKLTVFVLRLNTPFTGPTLVFECFEPHGVSLFDQRLYAASQKPQVAAQPDFTEREAQDLARRFVIFRAVNQGPAWI